MPNDMDREYVAWTGRKTSALRRPKLDCGHPKGEEVHFHLWCDRLSCSPECAEAEHDCGEFKGKSGIEEGAAPVEAVSPADAVAAWGMTAAQYVPWVAALRQANGIPEPTFTLADMEAASAAVQAKRTPWVCSRCRTEFSWDLPGLRRLHEANGCEPPTDDRPWWRRMLGGTR